MTSEIIAGRLLPTENLGGATNGYIAEPAIMHGMFGIVFAERRLLQNSTEDGKGMLKYGYVQIAILIDGHREMSWNILSKHILQFLGNRRC